MIHCLLSIRTNSPSKDVVKAACESGENKVEKVPVLKVVGVNPLVKGKYLKPKRPL